MLNIHHLTIPTPFSVGPVNVYLIANDPITLVDCGTLTKTTMEYLPPFLAQYGLVPKDVKRVVVTHAHADHFGVAHFFEEKHHTQVYCHPNDWRKATEGTAFWDEAGDFLSLCGVPPTQMDGIRGFYQDNRRFYGDLEEPQPLVDGGTVAFAEGELEVVYTPGHSWGCTCFFERSEGRLLTGDTLLQTISPNPTLEPIDAAKGERLPSLVLYLESLGRLTSFPVTQVLPGHGKPFADHRGRIAALQQMHQKRKEEIGELLQPEPRSPYQLAMKLYPDLPLSEISLAIAEVLAHLDLLLAEDRALRFLDSKGLTFAKA